MTASAPRVALIVGAGVGGLAAGVALQHAGWRVRVFERAAQPRELGFALLLAPNALASLDRLGLAARVIEQGSELTAGEIHGRGGRLLRRFDLSQVRQVLSQPPVVVLRPALHGVLLDALGRSALSLASEVRSFVADGGKPVITLANGQTEEGDVLIGADGVGSTIRRALHPDEPPPRASGLWAVRGVAHDVERHLADLASAQYFGRGVEGGTARAGRNAVYWYISVAADQLGGRRDAAAVARQCATQFDARFQAIVAATSPEDTRLDELLDRDPLPAWGRGSVTLLGDAAHPMLPHAGQGAAQALEDAVAIRRALDGAKDLESALRLYERVRAKRTAGIALIARRNARLASVSNPIGMRVRDVVLRIIPASVFTKAYVEFGTPPSLDFEE